MVKLLSIRWLRLTMLLMILVVSIGVLVSRNIRASKTSFMKDWSLNYPELVAASKYPRDPAFGLAITDSALQRTKANVRYDGAYVTIPYPEGDVPADKGVCTDVLIRAYRTLGIDLQKRVHEDMENFFVLYPNLWGLSRTDTNIDHRRVPNLMVFFSRHGTVLPITDDPLEYLPGDIVAWNTFDLTHIGFVVNVPSPKHERFMIVHNFGNGPELEDFLFDHEIIGHFRYEG